MLTTSPLLEGLISHLRGGECCAGMLLAGMTEEPGWSALGVPALQQQLLLGLASLAEALPLTRLRATLEALPLLCQSGGACLPKTSHARAYWPCKSCWDRAWRCNSKWLGLCMLADLQLQEAAWKGLAAWLQRMQSSSSSAAPLQEAMCGLLVLLPEPPCTLPGDFVA